MEMYIISGVQLLLYGLALLLVAWLVYLCVLYIIDKNQTTHAIRRNYPLIGRLRYSFESLGVFFRQYFFALDREELPFNRAERSWVYRAAKNLDNTVAFGSTRNGNKPNSIYFVNHPYPPLQQTTTISAITFGAHCPNPYSTTHFFHISGMSYGAISRPAVEALAAGAAQAGCWINSGEGGLSPYHLQAGADIVLQIGTAKNSVRNEQGGLDENKLRDLSGHPQVKMVEIKLSQGAKPGKGGIVPAAKVTAEIAAIRGIAQGHDAISPPRHKEIANDSELLDFIAKVKSITNKPVGFKCVLGNPQWIDDLCQEIIKHDVVMQPDFITIDGAEGGTGAAPMSLIDAVGMPLRESVSVLVDTLVKYGLKERIKVIASGKLITATNVAAVLCLGADCAVSARGFMFALGCIQALQCNQNSCPTGITTHNSKLQRGLVPADKTKRVTHYAHNMEKEVRMIASVCGVDDPHLLQRHHARIVQADGTSVSMANIYPGNKQMRG